MFELGPTVFVQIVNFIIVFFVLKKLLYIPLRKIMEERQQSIENSIKEAEMLNEKAKNLKMDFEKKMADAYKEAQKIIQEATDYAERLKQEIITKAREESSRIYRIAQKDIQLEKQKALAEVKNYVANLAIVAAGKILEDSLDEETHQKLMKDFLIKVEQINVN